MIGSIGLMILGCFGAISIGGLIMIVWGDFDPKDTHCIHDEELPSDEILFSMSKVRLDDYGLSFGITLDRRMTKEHMIDDLKKQLEEKKDNA